jgi:oligopeptidase B
MTISHNQVNISPPIAKKTPYQQTVHSQQLEDHYHWLREYPNLNNPEILDYLSGENNYYHQIMAQHQPQEDAIYAEIIARIKLKDTSVPIKKDDYFYYHRTEENSNYRIICRKHLTLENKEEILLDPNHLAMDSKYFVLGASKVSNHHQKIAYGVDLDGSERFVIRVKDLQAHHLLKDEIHDTIGNIVWRLDDRGFYYEKLNKDWRVDKIYYHHLGTLASEDKLIISEPDATFRLSICESASKHYVFINISSSDCNEIWYIKQDDEDMIAHLIKKRSADNLYEVEHHQEYFYILTNDMGKNFRLIKTNVGELEQKYWQEIIPHQNEVYLQNFSPYEDFFVVLSKENGLEQIKVYNYHSLQFELIAFPDASYKLSLNNTLYHDQSFRVAYSALNTPLTEFSYDYNTKKLQVLKVQEIPSGFNKENYQIERIWAASEDGVKVPISLVYHKELFKKDGSNPLYLYGYGSYGISVPASFRPQIFSLLDKGFIYAIAHIRGGDDLGFKWYEDAKFLNKKRTFQDFIHCAKHLIAKQYTSAGNIVIAGGSAGGMLVGACLNQASNLYKCAIAAVPFVDVLNTMLDESLPLTPGEFKEWGNPKDKSYFDYMLSYSPYDNVSAQKYPSIFVTAGINDPRVTYWESAKWVAKLRALKTDDNLLLYKVNLDAGHAGASGRFGYYRDLAQEYNFIFKVFGITC